MKILDWYILKKFFSTFFFAIILFTFITVVIDVSEKADDFVSSGVTTKQVITEYYFGFIPHIVSMLFPLFVFISVIFFTSKMAGRSEIVAILASGTSFFRFLRPYWVGAITLAIFLWLALRYVVPLANLRSTTFEAQYINKANFNTGGDNSTLYFRNDTTHYGSVQYYDTSTKRGSNFVLQEIVGGRLVSNIRAEAIFWDTTTKGWMLESVVIRKIDSLSEKQEQQSRMPVKLNFKAAEIKPGQNTKDVMPTPRLDRFIELEKLRGGETLNELLVEKYRRDATPASLILLTIIGVSVASRKVRGGSGLHLAIGFITASLFILADRFSTMFSIKGNFPPLIAAWTPFTIFLVVAFYLLKKAPK